MRYTIRNGVEHPFSGRINDNARFILPLLVILAGVLFFMFGTHHTSNKPHPLTLGVYSIKTSDQNDNTKTDSGDDNSGTSSGSAGTSSGLTFASQSPVTPSGSVLGTGSTAVSPVTTGGMGGGDTGGSGTPTTVSCVNQLTQTATVCIFPYQTCTIPLAGISGYKTVDGSCITIN